MSFEIEMGTRAMILYTLLNFQTTYMYISEYFTTHFKYHLKVKELLKKKNLQAWIKLIKSYTKDFHTFTKIK